MSAQETSPLPRSRAALEQARRLLDQLPDREDTVAEYRDLIPYVLDRLDNVWRTIDDESRGRRTHAFGTWWAQEAKKANRDAVKRLRNAHLKEGLIFTRRRSRYRFPGVMRVHEDGRVTFHLEDGTEVEGPIPTVHAETRWDFNLPNLRDKNVQDVLETVYRGLEQRILPSAERLLREGETKPNG